MKERPILFSEPMVKAILEGRKTQTRRIMKPQPEGDDVRICEEAYDWTAGVKGLMGLTAGDHNYELTSLKHRFGEVGDRLWVRETWWRNDGWEPHRERVALLRNWDGKTHCQVGKHDRCMNMAGDPDGDALERAGWVKKSPIFMPRWASRITLEITDIQAQRIGDITDEDAIKEGIEEVYDLRIDSHYYTAGPGIAAMRARHAYFDLWSKIHGDASVSPSQWVWVITFKRLEPS